jgi:beta-D-xylosidase 4
MSSFIVIAALAAAPVAFATQGRAFPDCSNGPLANNSICNTFLDPLSRATALISLFTLEEKMNNTGSTAPGVPRIGLPPYVWWNEGLHGVAYSPGVDFANSGNFSSATSFPQPILMGAAFDDELIEAVATVVSTEARAFNNDGRAGLGEFREVVDVSIVRLTIVQDFWTPNINPFKDPRWLVDMYFQACTFADR